jgi:SNF2 family DNA or RNA helicase
VERSVEVDFNDEEQQEYTALDDAARDFYIRFKANKGHKLSKHYLLLTQKLMPLRIAAAGGRVPLDDDKEGDHSEDSDNEEEEQEAEEEEEAETPKKKKKAKKKQNFSDFVYKSKFNALLDELKRARDDDPNGKGPHSIKCHDCHVCLFFSTSFTAKSLVFSQFTSTLGFLQQELPKHGFQFRTLSGDMPMAKRAKALHDFQHDPPTTVFLLSMRYEVLRDLSHSCTLFVDHAHHSLRLLFPLH